MRFIGGGLQFLFDLHSPQLVFLLLQPFEQFQGLASLGHLAALRLHLMQ
jgi:hypothetical protein